jgi:uncharacterized integral membrane protein
MRDVLIVLLVIALALMVVGLVNHDVALDVDYLFGTWHDTSLLVLCSLAAALVIIVGVVAALMTRLAMSGDRRKLEAELSSTYVRLRELESQLPGDEKATPAGTSAEPPPEALAADGAAAASAEPGADEVPPQNDDGQEPAAD